MNPPFLIRNALLVALVTLSVFFATQSSAFLTVGNAKNVAINSSILSVVVVASALLVIAGHLDLSIGSTTALGGLVMALAVTSWDLNAATAIALAIGTGAGVGAINGLLCGVLGFSPIIVTLGMLGAVRGLALLISDAPVFGLGHPFDTLGASEFAGVPILVLFAVASFAIGAVFLALTPWGHYVYAIGVNPVAAYLSGLPVRTLPFLLYVASGASAGLAGVLYASRLDGVSPGDIGVGLEISALTAVLLGGVAFAGGRGRISGVLVAVIFLGILDNGLLLMNVSPFVQRLTQGLALIAAAALDIAAAYYVARAARRRSTGQDTGDGSQESRPAPMTTSGNLRTSE